jgi:putative transcriptional regulator
MTLWIKEFRMKNNLTQEQLAQKVGVSWVTISRWERGLVKPSSLAAEKLKKLEVLL